MKKLFYLLFISFVLVSCTKQEPVEVVCTCDGAANGTGTSSSSSSLIDTNLIGHWKNTNPLINIGTHPGFVDSSSLIPFTDIDVYFSPDGVMHLNHSFTRLYDNGNTWPVAAHVSNEYDFKLIDDGILCIDNKIIHYEINNSIMTYYSEQGLDLSINAYWYYNAGQSPSDIVWSESITSINLFAYMYLVSTNSLTKQ